MIKTLKTAGIIILAVVAILMIGSVFIPSQVHIERNITIDAPKEMIFQQVNNLQNWTQWSPWLAGSSSQMEGPDSGVGAAIRFRCGEDTARATRLTITKSDPFEFVEMEVEQKKYSGKSIFKFEELPEGVRAIWTINADMGKKPFRKYYGLFLDKIVGREIEESLINLKNLSEANARAL